MFRTSFAHPNHSALLLTIRRTYALHKHRPISLYPTIHPPSLDEVPSDRPIAVGLELMINMFKIIDDTFVNLWNRVHNTHASPAWISQVQIQLSEAVPAYFECTEAQEVQIRITQQWLRSQAWQLSVCQGLVSSVSNDNTLTFKYPIDVARDLLTVSHRFPQQAMEVHGVGLVSHGLAYCRKSSCSVFFRFPTPQRSFARCNDPCHISIFVRDPLGNVYL